MAGFSRKKTIQQKVEEAPVLMRIKPKKRKKPIRKLTVWEKLAEFFKGKI